MLKDKHVYSYSQLSSFSECPYGFYLQRIEKVDDLASSAFSERGTLIHDLLDQWAKGKLKKEDMPGEYERRYSSEVITAFPAMMKGYAEKAYNSGLEFLQNFDEFPGYTVLSAEERFTIDLPLTDGTSRPFTGVVDLILKENWTEKLIVCDHKSKSMASFKKNEKEMYKQQYLYSQYVYEKYGKWPDILMFHLFGEAGEKPEKPFDLKEFREAIQWATDCIHGIENYTVLDWMKFKDSSDFYCHELCAPRKYCSKSIEKPKTKKELAQEKEQQEEDKLPEIPAEDQPVELKCECGAAYIPGKRKCPVCKAWYKVRK